MIFTILLQLLGLTPVLCMADITRDLLTPIQEYGEGCGYSSCPIMKQNVLNVHIVPSTHAELGYTRTFYEHYTGHEQGFDYSKINMKQILDAVLTSLWTDNRRKMLLKLPRFSSASGMFAQVRTDCFQAIIRKKMASLVRRIRGSENSILKVVAEDPRAPVLRHLMRNHCPHEMPRRFTFSDIPYLFHWWKNRDDTVKRMVYELLRQGRLYFVGGGWAMSDEATTSYHAIIDQFTYSLRKINATFLECGRPLVTWQADVFGHSKEFASLMAQMGFDAHFINPISFDDELTRMKSKSLEFVWRGSDDLGSVTDIYTHKLFDGYWTPPGFCFGGFCNDPLIIMSDSTFKNVEERVEAFMNSMLKRQSPYYTTKHIMVIMGQRLGYYDATVWFDNIDKLIYNLNAKQKSEKKKVYLFYSTPACYMRAVHEAEPKLTTKQDDFYPFSYDKDTHASGAYTSRPVVKHIARELHQYLQIAKHLQIFGQLKNNDQKFEEIMWIHGAIQDHTIITGGSPQRVIEYYTKKAFLAKEMCLSIYRQAFNNLRGSSTKLTYYACQFNISSCSNIQGDRFFAVIYNPLAWPVTMPVRFPVARGIYEVYDPKGVQQNHSIISVPDLVTLIPGRGEFFTEDELVFIAQDLPPMGYRSYYIQQIQVRTRTKKSIIKKLNKKSYSHFIIRQTNNLKIDDKPILDDVPDYEYFEDVTKSNKTAFQIRVGGSTVEFVNGSKEMDHYSDYGFTPPARTVFDLTTPANGITTENITPSSTTFAPTRSSTTITTTTEDNKRTTTPKATMSTTTTEATLSTTTTEAIMSTTTTEATMRTTDTPIPILGKTTPVTYLEYYYEEVTEPTSSTPRFEVESIYRRMEKIGYLSSESTDHFIRNEYIRINLDSQSKLASIELSNGLNITFDVQMCYYISDDPEKMNTKKKKPGAYVFRPMDSSPIIISTNYEVKVVKSAILEEIQITFANYAGLTFTLYKGLPTIEVDWIVGPIPYADNFGKELFVRYTTDVMNKGVFFTDSNGRQTIKRIRDVRATYTPVLNTSQAGIASNTYPVTSKIYIEDKNKNIRFSVFTDRTQGGTSLFDGAVDMMLHRRIFTDDIGTRAWLNETEYDRGLVIRGKHHLYISKANYRPHKVFEKKFAKELELGPAVFTSIHQSYFNITYEGWLQKRNEFSALNKKLPVGVHILTLEKWQDNFLLLRLENYLEKSDVVKSGFKRVLIKQLFSEFTIDSVTETTLAANIWLKDHVTLHWQKEKFVKSFNDVYGNQTIEYSKDQGGFKPVPVIDLNDGIELTPQQIRTFVVRYTRVKH